MRGTRAAKESNHARTFAGDLRVACVIHHWPAAGLADTEISSIRLRQLSVRRGCVIHPEQQPAPNRNGPANFPS